MQLIYFDTPWKVKFLLLIHNSFNTWAGWLDWRRNSASGLDGESKDQTLPPGWMLDQVSNKYIPSGFILSETKLFWNYASRSSHGDMSLYSCINVIPHDIQFNVNWKPHPPLHILVEKSTYSSAWVSSKTIQLMMTTSHLLKETF